MPAGRPPANIDWEQVDRLCHIQCTGPEIAAVLDLDRSTLEKRCKKDHRVNLSAYIKEKSSQGRMSLRRWQFEAARKGNPALLIWLGKQYLEQSDKHEVDSRQTTVEISLTPEDVRKIIEGDPFYRAKRIPATSTG